MADVAMLVALALFVLFLVLDVLRPARANPEVKGWRLKGVAFALLALALNATLPPLLVEAVGERALLPGARLGTLGGFAAGLLAMELLAYWVHRACHRVDVLWRWVHQAHHAAERFDTFGAFFFHPLDLLQNVVLWTLGPALLLGLTPEAAGLVGVASFTLAWFQHANVHTPRWLGLVVQRPEAHGVHHQRGVHDFNFGNLSVWDQVFGTFRNPAQAPAEAGFGPGVTARLGDLLLGEDLSGGAQGHAATAAGVLSAPARAAAGPAR